MKKLWLFSALFLKLMDVTTTYIAISAGACREANPIAAYAIDHIGLGWAMILDYGISVYLLFALYKITNRIKKYGVLYFVTVLLLGVVVNNLFRMYQRGMF